MLDDLEQLAFDQVEVQMTIYALAKTYHTRGRPERYGNERRLWAAVINQAVEDLFLYPKAKRPSANQLLNCQRIRASARHFLFGDSPDIVRYRKFVFLCAGLNIEIAPEGLRREAEEFERTHQ